MTGKRLAGVYGCKGVFRREWGHVVHGCGDAKAGRVSACHCEERSDVAIRSPRSNAKWEAAPKANPQLFRICPSSGQLARLSCGRNFSEFAQAAANLLGSPAGKRIATPVCALVRNDVQKAGGRLRDVLPGRKLGGVRRRWALPQGWQSGAFRRVANSAKFFDLRCQNVWLSLQRLRKN